MSRIKLKKVSADGDDVPDEHIVKGYEISRRAATSWSTPTSSSRSSRRPPKTIELEEFVDLDEIDPSTSTAPYYRGARQDTQAVRAAGAGDGAGRQGGHRPLRDAQQAVRGGAARRRRAS
jgi:hypothetical protein